MGIYNIYLFKNISKKSCHEKNFSLKTSLLNTLNKNIQM